MTSLPQKYKAAVYDEPGTISTKIVELDMPEPGPGEVLINLTHSGVCHSDMGVMLNAWRTLPFPTQAGQVGGHEGVGKIVKMGAGTENSAVKVGDRVGVKWVSGICESCPACLAGKDGVCFNCKISGYYTPGTFQQYVCGPANYVTPIPEGVSSDAAAPLLCAGVTVYSALRKAGTEGGEWVAMLGAGGGLGHLAVQIAAKGMGLRVIGVDSGSKEELVKDCGAEVFIDFSKGDPVEAVKKATGGLGVKSVLVLTAANAAYTQALDMLSFGGTLVAVGIPEGDLKPISNAYPASFIMKEIRIVGSAVGNRKEAIDTMAFAARGILKTHFKTIKMEELTSTFESMDKGQITGRVVVDLS